MDSLQDSAALYEKMADQFKAATNESNLRNAIVNAAFDDPTKATSLSLGVTVLLVVDSKNMTINRVALSDTDSAKGAVRMSAKPFTEIKIPLNHEENIIAKAIKTQEFQMTSDWADMFVPALTPVQARFNQAGAGIGCSVVYPVNNETAMIFSFYTQPEKIGGRHYKFMEKYTSLVAEYLT